MGLISWVWVMRREVWEWEDCDWVGWEWELGCVVGTYVDDYVVEMSWNGSLFGEGHCVSGWQASPLSRMQSIKVLT